MGRGFLEVVVILALVCGVLLLVRNSKRGTVKTTPQHARLQQPDTAALEEARVKIAHRNHLRWLGIAIIVVGLIALGYILSLVINPVYILCAAAALIILTGIIIIIISMRR
jgi:hypothetical protein